MSQASVSARITARSALIWIGIAAGIFLLWKLRLALLVVLGAVLGAILLRALALFVCKVTRISYRWGLSAATIIIVLCLAYVVWTFGSTLLDQFGAVLAQVKSGELQLSGLLSKVGLNSLVNQTFLPVQSAAQAILSAGLELLEAAVIIALSAIFLAANPDVYWRGLAKLFPAKNRDWGIETLELIGAALRQWLLGQLVLMLIVGLGSYIAVLIIGLPNALALGILAGLTEIVPYIGPFIGGAPAVLVALARGGLTTPLITAAAYLGLHILEGYIVGPLLQRHFVHIPPVLILISLFMTPLIFGPPGFLLAAPLTVVIFTAAKALYVRDTLGEPVDLPET